MVLRYTGMGKMDVIQKNGIVEYGEWYMETKSYRRLTWETGMGDQWS